MIRRLHTVLVGLYNQITPAEAHPLPIRSEKGTKEISKKLYEFYNIKNKIKVPMACDAKLLKTKRQYTF